MVIMNIGKRLMDFSKKNDLRDYSLREIGKLIHPKGLDINPQNIKYHWLKLFKSGDINYLPQTPKTEDFIKIPIRGYADCGIAKSVAENEDLGHITLTRNFLRTIQIQGYFAIIASGDSMNQASINGKSINDGDYIIVDSKHISPRNGDYVVVIVDNLANVKRFYNQKDRIVLISESTNTYDSIILTPSDRPLISGIVKHIVSKIDKKALMSNSKDVHTPPNTTTNNRLNTKGDNDE